MMNIGQLQDQLWQNPKRVVFTEGQNVAVLRAALRLVQTGWAKPIIVGNPFEIRAFAEANKMRTRGLSLKKPLHDPNFDAYSRYYRKTVEPGLSYQAAKEKLQQPLYYAALMIKHGQADVCFTSAPGDLSTLLDVARIFSAEKPFVSASTVIWNEHSGQSFLFADTFVNARPNSDELARIAADSAQTFRKLNGQMPSVALLSFSTKGSADHPRVQVVRDAVQQLKKQHPDLKVDGELQFDAAFVPEILSKKAPQSAIQAPANVFVFPSLNAADAGVKIVQTLSLFKTAGPLVQGLPFAVHFLAPEADAEQIIQQVVIASSLLNA